MFRLAGNYCSARLQAFHAGDSDSIAGDGREKLFLAHQAPRGATTFHFSYLVRNSLERPQTFFYFILPASALRIPVYSGELRQRSGEIF